MVMGNSRKIDPSGYTYTYMQSKARKKPSGRAGRAGYTKANGWRATTRRLNGKVRKVFVKVVGSKEKIRMQTPLKPAKLTAERTYTREDVRRRQKGRTKKAREVDARQTAKTLRGGTNGQAQENTLRWNRAPNEYDLVWGRSQEPIDTRGHGK